MRALDGLVPASGWPWAIGLMVLLIQEGLYPFQELFRSGNERGVSTIGKGGEACAGNQCRQRLGGGQGHQRIVRAVDQKGRCRDQRRERAQVHVAQPAQAGRQRGGGRQRVGEVEQDAKLDGRNMIMVLGPK